MPLEEVDTERGAIANEGKLRHSLDEVATTVMKRLEEDERVSDLAGREGNIRVREEHELRRMLLSELRRKDEETWRREEEIRRREEEVSRREKDVALREDEVKRSEEQIRNANTKRAALLSTTTRTLAIQSILVNAAPYKLLLKCVATEAQTILDAFQWLLDTNVFPDRRKLIVAMQRLSAKTELYPLRYIVRERIQLIESKPLNSGRFADVYKANLGGDSQVLCLKVIRAHTQSLIQRMKRIYAKEAIIWGQLFHPNLLPFYGLHMFDSQIAFLAPWAENGNLRDYLLREPHANRMLLCSDTAAGIEYLHANDVVHGDLKAVNVLVDMSGRACLADFGLSGVTDKDIVQWTTQSAATSRGGTSRWQAPELHDPEIATAIHNTKESDIYAWASTCYEVFTNELPFYEILRETTVLMSILGGKHPTRPHKTDPSWDKRGLREGVWKLLEDCWNREPSQRPDISNVISRLNRESPSEDPRLPGQWQSEFAMRFRNTQNQNFEENQALLKSLDGILSRVLGEFHSSDVEIQLREGELRQREKEVEEAMRVLEKGLRIREEVEERAKELKERENEIRLQEMDIQRKAEEAHIQEEEAKRRQEAASEEAHRMREKTWAKEQEIRYREERRQKEELRRLEQVSAQKEAERKQKEDEESRKEAERLQKQYDEEAQQKQAEELRKLEEKFRHEQQQQEFRRREQEIQERKRQGAPYRSSTPSARPYTFFSPSTGVNGQTPGWSSSSKASASKASFSASASTASSASPTPKLRSGSVNSTFPTSTPSPRPQASSTTDEAEWKRKQEEFYEQQERFREEQQRYEDNRQRRESNKDKNKDKDKDKSEPSKEQIAALLERHERQWNILVSDTAALHWQSFPWPMFDPPRSPEDITLLAVTAYTELFEMKGKPQKDHLRDLIKRWHPDRSESKYLPRTVEGDREKVKEGMGVVIRLLNNLRAKVNLANNPAPEIFG